jgi:hypothetical protein
MDIAIELTKGSNLMKYGRIGKPQARKFYLSEDKQYELICGENGLFFLDAFAGDPLIRKMRQPGTSCC